MDSKSMKVTIVGDGAVGKTCLLLTYTTGICPGSYIPTIFDNYNQNICVDGKVQNLSLWDTAGQEDFDRLRPLSYPGTDVFLVCYSISDHNSFNNLRYKWINEIQEYCEQGAIIILVGTKSDTRDDINVISQLKERHMEPISSQMGQDFANECGASAFIECSSTTSQGVDQIFEQAVREVRYTQASRRKINKQRQKRGLFRRLVSTFSML
mmetsp:Transcript_47316/g.60782  ORF Transcript_47316/g.60782 Transcript_47316/m.60782 type:complete len:210 (+) Transcript_47316:92-721(+)